MLLLIRCIVCFIKASKAKIKSFVKNHLVLRTNKHLDSQQVRKGILVALARQETFG